jgi:hypothetical protein
MNKILKKVFIVAFTFVALSSTFAGFWDALIPYRGPKNDIITLIITANYKHPLVIAQLLQDEIKQPYLLLPAANGKGIFFNPPRKRSQAALEIKEENITRFVRFLNPKQILVLGDKRYVAERYIQMIDKDIPIITLSGNNWQKIADRLSILLAAPNVGYDYKQLGQQLDSGLYKPTASKNIDNKTDSAASIEDIIVDEKIVKDIKKDTKEITKAKEPEVVMPKSTPALINDK